MYHQIVSGIRKNNIHNKIKKTHTGAKAPGAYNELLWLHDFGYKRCVEIMAEHSTLQIRKDDVVHG